MARLDPALVPAVADLARGLRSLDVPFAIVGALVPELLLEAPPAAMTNDADVTVAVASLAEFATLKSQLGTFGLRKAAPPTAFGIGRVGWWTCCRSATRSHPGAGSNCDAIWY